MKKRAVLRFNQEKDQWFAQIGQKFYPMYCGESFLLGLGNKNYQCRLERDESWYIILPKTRFTLHPLTDYTVIL
ncbi:hypothetical protein JCM15765_18290 [Paradesulfitobacterium aromaticivorans]